MDGTAARIVAASAMALALALFPARPRAADDPFEMISVDQAAQMLGQADVKIYDANPADVYAEAHLPGAIFVEKPLADRLPKDKGARLVFYCKNPK
jgi:3-mercaptopyruvate sulfurtransferase SseA